MTRDQMRRQQWENEPAATSEFTKLGCLQKVDL